MTQPPAGWYPEPDPAYAGQPGRLRYWDGQSWTEHTHDPAPQPAPPPASTEQPAPPPVQQPPGQPSYPQASQPSPYPSYGSYQQPYPQYGQQYGQPYQQPEIAAGTTPDGVRLSGWWLRVAAKLLDGLISLPLTALAVTPVVAWQWDSIHQWFDDLRYATDNNTANPPTPDIFTVGTGPWLVFILASLVAYLVYEVVFLLWKQATPGKLILGLRVRLRESPALPASAVFARVSILVLGQFCGLLILLDDLWPLWDSKKQALHDKIAKTNVVKIR